MNAPVDITAQRAKSRRQNTFDAMRNALRLLSCEAERVSLLGNDEAAIALARFRKNIELIGNQAASLHAEFVELGEIAHEQAALLAHSQQQGNEETT